MEIVSNRNIRFIYICRHIVDIIQIWSSSDSMQLEGKEFLMKDGNVSNENIVCSKNATCELSSSVRFKWMFV